MMAWQRRQLMRAAAAAALAFSMTASGVVLMAQDSPDTLVETQAARPFLGVRLADGNNGVEVVAVGEGSPAEAAGIETGDILVRVGDTDVTTSTEAADAIAALAAGDAVSITVQRDGEEQTLEATLTEIPEMVTVTVRPGSGHGMHGGRLEGAIERLGGSNFAYDSETDQWTVSEIADDSPLYEAGLRAGDVITAVNGETLNREGLRELFGTLLEADTVTLTIERDGESQDVEIAIQDLFSFERMPQMFQFGGRQGLRDMFQGRFDSQGGRLGLSFLPLDEDTAAENDVAVTEGALVMEVMADLPAAEAGLEAGDVITAVNGEPVNEEWTLRNRIAAYEAGDVITLEVLRGDETLQLEVTLGEIEMASAMGMMPFSGFSFDGSNIPFGFDMLIPMPEGAQTAPSSNPNT
ncbi:MAG: PDZ domain-containing protein [Anaerolineae bacterium]|nr:PDZ domain-containing protein [Anaerolineae bacterium]